MAQRLWTIYSEKPIPPELFSSKNGILISRLIEEHFEKGKIVTAPDIQAKLSMETVLTRLKRKPREYKTLIIDSTWELLNKQIHPQVPLKWKDLHHK
jgi:hypothetical protein